ncbi:MAG TPA: LD-carboxypeptidase [Puia sp.]|jgi:muramoyltetrapeptide carboxypeptidase|nr:LD-carboxypeptidase [Puia sp.]
MKRKSFLGALFGGPLLASANIRSDNGTNSRVFDDIPWRIPPYLKPGDTIGITCPAGFMTPEEIQPSVQTIKSWGFNLRIGRTVGARDFIFGGTDEERLADLQQMLDDPSIQAIMCARGGYGCVRIIDRLNWKKFMERPKWIIGFSDITVIHAQLNHQYHVASIHSKMCNSFPEISEQVEKGQWESILSIEAALTGKRIDYPIVYDPGNRTGVGQGILAGGNLKTIENLAGSASDLRTDGMILFLEDTGEYLYSIDRMFYNLKRTGKLENLNGLLIGAFRVKPDDPGDEFGRSVYNIVLEQVAGYKYPVCFNFPVGHVKTNYALKCGVSHELNISSERVSFKETL